MNSKSLEGQVALVTGGNRGIGLSVAKKFASEGASVIICSTKEEGAKKVASELARDYGIASHGLGVDIASEDSVQEMMKASIAVFGRLDILVNNAGITRDNLMLRMSSSEWNDVLSTNLNGLFYTTRAALKPMLRQKSGKIINMSSVVGIMGNAGQANYAASKGGMIAFSKTIAKEYGAKGIRCNVVAPGFIETEMLESLPKEYFASIIPLVPQKRLGKSEEIANVVFFLASDLSSYMTGQVLTVDGGLLM